MWQNIKRETLLNKTITVNGNLMPSGHDRACLYEQLNGLALTKQSWLADYLVSSRDHLCTQHLFSSNMQSSFLSRESRAVSYACMFCIPVNLASIYNTVSGGSGQQRQHVYYFCLWSIHLSFLRLKSSTYIRSLTTSCNSAPGTCHYILFWPTWAIALTGVYSHTQHRNIYTCN